MSKSGYAVLGGACALAISAAAARRAEPAEKPAPAAVEAARQALVGQWQLNTSLSDDPRAKMREGAGGGGGDRGWPVAVAVAGVVVEEAAAGAVGAAAAAWAAAVEAAAGAAAAAAAWAAAAARRAPRPPGARCCSRLLSSRSRTSRRRSPCSRRTARCATSTRTTRATRTTTAPKSRRAGTRASSSSTRRASAASVKETWTVASEPRRLEVLLEVERPFGDTVKIKRVYDPVDPNAPKKEAPAAAPCRRGRAAGRASEPAARGGPAR